MATPGELNKQLFDAVRRNDIVAATALLERGANVNSRGSHWNQTVLIEASRKGYKALVELLLCRGAAINETDRDGNTALIEAARRGYQEIVDLLLQKNADVDKEGEVGWTAIHFAAVNKDPSIINRLVSCGATVDIDTNEGKTPLWFAAYNGNVNCVDVLLNVGANPRHRSKSEGSPLDVAKKKGHNEVMKRLNDAVKSSQAHPLTASLHLHSASATVAPPQTRPQATRAAKTSDVQRSMAQLQVTNTVRQSDQRQGVTPTRKDEELVRQLIEQVEEKNRQIEQKQNELDAAVREKSTMEAEMRQQLETVQRERRSLLHALEEERREKTTLQQQVENLRENVRQSSERQQELEERLDASMAATKELRHVVRQSEEVQNIPSRDIQLTTQKLGKGSYGEVRIGYWQGCPVAVKMLYEVLAESQHNIQLLLQEVSIGWKTHHPNIAGVCGVTLELQEEKKTAWIVMELLQGSMAGVIEAPKKGALPLTLREQVDMAVDSACGLNYLHSLSRLVLHGDIRPTNILVTAVMRAKLGDLGAARFSDATLSVGLVSPEYTAPERMDGRCPQKCKETDVYSMGVTLCELFTGLPPNPRVRMDQIQRIQQRDVFLLSKHMVAHDPKQRPSAAEAFTVIGRIRQSYDYKGCPPRRMVKGKADGEDFVTLTDCMW